MYVTLDRLEVMGLVASWRRAPRPSALLSAKEGRSPAGSEKSAHNGRTRSMSARNQGALNSNTLESWGFVIAPEVFSFLGGPNNLVERAFKPATSAFMPTFRGFAGYQPAIACGSVTRTV
jgi:hypothetical protein